MAKAMKKEVVTAPKGQEVVVEYGNPEETPGTWKLTAMIDGRIIGKEDKLPAGSNVIYFRKSEFRQQPKSVTVVLTLHF